MRHELLREDQASPVFALPGGRSSLVVKPERAPRYVITKALPIGAQERMMRAAAFSEALGHPLNAILTVNAEHLQRIGEGGVFGVGHLWDGFQALRELMRKWLRARGVPWAVIWAREWSRRGKRGQAGEHWHIALHLPEHLHGAFAEQVAQWTGEAVGTLYPSRKEAAVSAGGAWHVSVKSGRGTPKNVAVYLGKAEPNTRLRYRQRVDNLKKQVRRYGGEGPVGGQRYGISKPIGATEQQRAIKATLWRGYA